MSFIDTRWTPRMVAELVGVPTEDRHVIDRAIEELGGTPEVDFRAALRSYVMSSLSPFIAMGPLMTIATILGDYEAEEEFWRDMSLVVDEEGVGITRTSKDSGDKNLYNCFLEHANRQEAFCFLTINIGRYIAKMEEYCRMSEMGATEENSS